jgi:hypothetical protein
MYTVILLCINCCLNKWYNAWSWNMTLWLLTKFCCNISNLLQFYGLFLVTVVCCLCINVVNYCRFKTGNKTRKVSLLYFYYMYMLILLSHHDVFQGFFHIIFCHPSMSYTLRTIEQWTCIHSFYLSPSQALLTIYHNV